jgi:hypothetical protein
VRFAGTLHPFALPQADHLKRLNEFELSTLECRGLVALAMLQEETKDLRHGEVEPMKSSKGGA